MLHASLSQHDAVATALDVRASAQDAVVSQLPVICAPRATDLALVPRVDAGALVPSGEGDEQRRLRSLAHLAHSPASPAAAAAAAAATSHSVHDAGTLRALWLRPSRRAVDTHRGGSADSYRERVCSARRRRSSCCHRVKGTGSSSSNSRRSQRRRRLCATPTLPPSTTAASLSASPSSANAMQVSTRRVCPMCLRVLPRSDASRRHAVYADGGTSPYDDDDDDKLDKLDNDDDDVDDSDEEEDEVDDSDEDVMQDERYDDAYDRYDDDDDECDDDDDGGDDNDGDDGDGVASTGESDVPVELTRSRRCRRLRHRLYYTHKPCRDDNDNDDDDDDVEHDDEDGASRLRARVSGAAAKRVHTRLQDNALHRLRPSALARVQASPPTTTSTRLTAANASTTSSSSQRLLRYASARRRRRRRRAPHSSTDDDDVDDVDDDDDYDDAVASARTMPVCYALPASAARQRARRADRSRRRRRCRPLCDAVLRRRGDGRVDAAARALRSPVLALLPPPPPSSSSASLRGAVTARRPRLADRRRDYNAYDDGDDDDDDDGVDDDDDAAAARAYLTPAYFRSLARAMPLAIEDGSRSRHRDEAVRGGHAAGDTTAVVTASSPLTTTTATATTTTATTTMTTHGDMDDGVRRHADAPTPDVHTRTAMTSTTSASIAPVATPPMAVAPAVAAVSASSATTAVTSEAAMRGALIPRPAMPLATIAASPPYARHGGDADDTDSERTRRRGDATHSSATRSAPTTTTTVTTSARQRATAAARAHSTPTQLGLDEDVAVVWSSSSSSSSEGSSSRSSSSSSSRRRQRRHDMDGDNDVAAATRRGGDDTAAHETMAQTAFATTTVAAAEATTAAAAEMSGTAATASPLLPPHCRDRFAYGFYKQFFVELRKLGSGTFGGVYLCEHVMAGVPLGRFALKKIPVGDHNAYLQKMLREVRMLQRVRRHANVVEYNYSWVEEAQVADFGPPVRCLFVLMEYATQGSLDAYMARHGVVLSTMAVWYIFLSAVAGTAYLHRKHILHRDLKPQNLLLTGGSTRPRHYHRHGGLPRVLVSDFGTAAALHDVPYEERTGGTGTLEYMAPEMLERATVHDDDDAQNAQNDGNDNDVAANATRTRFVHRPTTASDVWALGMVLHYLACAGTLPARQASDGGVVLDVRAASPLPRPPEMVQLMHAMLQRDPARRPSCADILHSPLAQSMLHAFHHSTRLGAADFLPRALPAHRLVPHRSSTVHRHDDDNDDDDDGDSDDDDEATTTAASRPLVRFAPTAASTARAHDDRETSLHTTSQTRQPQSSSSTAQHARTHAGRRDATRVGDGDDDDGGERSSRSVRGGDEAARDDKASNNNNNNNNSRSPRRDVQSPPLLLLPYHGNNNNNNDDTMTPSLRDDDNSDDTRRSLRRHTRARHVGVDAAVQTDA